MDFRFTNEYSLGKLDEIVAYMMGPRLWIPPQDYPDGWEWAQKAHGELKSQTKRAMVAFSGGEVVGVLVYQRHKQLCDALELKRLTVRPDQRGRYVASFLLRNSEIEGRADFGSTYILADSKAKNLGIKSFLLHHHYRVIGKEDLYGLSAGEDLVYRKDFTDHRHSGIV